MPLLCLHSILNLQFEFLSIVQAEAFQSAINDNLKGQNQKYMLPVVQFII